MQDVGGQQQAHHLHGDWQHPLAESTGMLLKRECPTSVALSALSRQNTMALQMSVLDTVMARSRSSKLHAIPHAVSVMQ